MPITNEEAARLVPEGIPGPLASVLVEILSYHRGSCPPRRRLELCTPPDVLDSYVRSGWLASWTMGPEDEPCVTLSGWTAELLNVHLVEVLISVDGRKLLTSVWGKMDEEDDQERVTVRGFSVVDIEILKLHRDPAPDVLELLVDEETQQTIRLFAGPDGQGAGIEVKIDPRLGKKKAPSPKKTRQPLEKKAMSETPKIEIVTKGDIRRQKARAKAEALARENQARKLAEIPEEPTRQDVLEFLRPKRRRRELAGVE